MIFRVLMPLLCAIAVSSCNTMMMWPSPSPLTEPAGQPAALYQTTDHLALTCTEIEGAAFQWDGEDGEYDIEVSITETAAQKVGQFTGAHIDEQMVLVAAGQLVADEIKIRTPVRGRQAHIFGNGDDGPRLAEHLNSQTCGPEKTMGFYIRRQKVDGRLVSPQADENGLIWFHTDNEIPPTTTTATGGWILFVGQNLIGEADTLKRENDVFGLNAL